MDRVCRAAADAGKASGILLMNTESVPPMLDRGMTFVAVGSDGGLVANGMRATATALAANR